MTRLLLVAAGGALGAALRYAIAAPIQRPLGDAFPVGTLIVNVLGCFLIGLLATLFNGPLRLGEFAWSIENLLNRVLSQTLTRSPDIIAVVRDAVAMLPVLVDELEYGSPPAPAADAIAARADAIAGREGGGLPAAAPAPARPPAAPAQAVEEDQSAGTAQPLEGIEVIEGPRDMG